MARKYRRNKKKRQARRYNRRRRAYTIRLKKSVYGFPDAGYTKLSYTTGYTIAPATYYHQVDITGDGPWDPDLTAGGTNAQPAQWDNYAAIYNRYQCYASAITVRFCNTTSASPVFLAVYPNDDSTSLSSPEAYMSQTRSRTRICGPLAANPVAVVKHYATQKQIHGRTIDANQFAAATTANPNDPWYWNIYAQCTDSSTNITGSLWITVVYYIKFYDKKLQNLS